ncbi:MAG: hypothetical protein ABIR62_15145, partial [Dokdonella sp.]|uniref:hypothetical protein n=1 Tax=Dokdonella sp. TaxID=2291710 RepID=UPI0032663C44
LQVLQTALANDAKQKDWPASLADAKRLRAFLNDAPTARLEVARTYLRLGDHAAALAQVQGFLALGQTNAVLSSPSFEPIHAAIGAQIQKNSVPVSRTRAVFKLPASLLPEDIDVDPVTQRFFVTTILGRNIVAVDANGVSRPFADAPDAWPMAALKIDVKRRRLWATELAFNTFDSVAADDRGRSALLEYDLDHATLLRRLEAPANAALGDMTLAPNGDPIVSDGEGGGIYRAHDGVLHRLDHGEFISPQTPASCANPNVVIIPDYVRGLATLDLASGHVTWFSGASHALYGIDGLYCRGRTLTATQNGASPARVVAFQLDVSQTTIIDERVIERGTTVAADVTHGVFVGRTFHFIANAGWAAMDEKGVPNDLAHSPTAVLMKTRD